MNHKAQVKWAKRITMATRMRDFGLLCYWCTGNTMYMARAHEYNAQLHDLVARGKGDNHGKG